MALPKLNDQPKYDLVIPSTQQTVRYRPFLVKEEKVLLLAMESQDQNQILNSIVDTIKACVQNDIDVSKLHTYDTEYMFLQIRSKSVGEVSKVSIACEECGEKHEVDIPIEQIEIKGSGDNKIIQLNDSVSVELSYPSYHKLMDDKGIQSENTAESLFAMIRLVIKTVLTEDERINMSDEPLESVNEFIESMNNEQFTQIKEFVDAMPKLTYTAEFKCGDCGHDNSIVLEGIQSFF